MPSKPLLLASVLLVVLSNCALAQQAERCEGTLCDLYYGSRKPEADKPAQPAGATPLMVPRFGSLIGGGSQAPAQPGATPAARPMVGVGGGGISGMMRGDSPERCSGTICDLYYGGPPAERPATPQGGQAGTVPAQPAEAQTADAQTGEPEPEIAPARHAPPRCVSHAGDPWSCYRH